MAENKSSRKALLVIAPNLRYKDAWDIQNELHERRKRDKIPDVLLLTDHPPVYTLGKNAKLQNLLIPEQEVAKRGIDLHHIDRGGDITFHGPGQLVGYPIFDLHHFYQDVGRFLREMEESLMVALSHFGIKSGRQVGLTGVWVGNEKVAAIGIKLSRWFTKHGFALNVSTDLSYFENIIPCGISDKAVTSMEKLTGKSLTISEVVPAVEAGFSQVFSIDFAHAELKEVLEIKKTFV